MLHSYVAYIDEAGDEGFTFRESQAQSSSEWFVISAIVVRASRKPHEMRLFKQAVGKHYNGHWQDLHFRTLKHEQRAALSYYLRHRPFRMVSVCWNKRRIHEDAKPHTLDQGSKLHQYSIRYLLERLSWLAWDHRKSNTPDPMKLIFSRCKNLSYGRVSGYLQYLRTLDTEIRWNLVDVDNFQVGPPTSLLGLKAADCTASGIRLGLELNRHGLTIGTYARHLSNIAYGRRGKMRRKPKILGYGLKFMPEVPDPEPRRDNRYCWVKHYR